MNCITGLYKVSYLHPRGGGGAGAKDDLGSVSRQKVKMDEKGGKGKRKRSKGRK